VGRAEVASGSHRVTLERDAVAGPSGSGWDGTGYEDALVPPPSRRHQPRTGSGEASRSGAGGQDSRREANLTLDPIEFAARSVSASLAPRLAAERQRRAEEFKYSQRVAVETRAAFGGNPAAEATSAARPSWLQDSIERAAHAAALAVLGNQTARLHKPNAAPAPAARPSLAASAAVGHAGRGIQHVAATTGAAVGTSSASPRAAYTRGGAISGASGIAGVGEGLARDLLAERDRQLERRVGRDPESVRLARIMASSSGRVG